MRTIWQRLTGRGFVAAIRYGLRLLAGAAAPRKAVVARPSIHAALLTMLSSLAVTVAAASAADAREPELVVVFDGSGSIWGRFDGTNLNKRDLIRGALSSSLRTHLPNAAVGLVTFGAQSSNSCEAAGELLPPKSGQLDEFDALLGTLNPQGRGPIVLGLKTAISSLPAQSAEQSGGQRLLLIHDNPDNCGQDVCAFARDLAKTRPGIVVDVLSLAPKAADQGGMACLTTATGGRLAEVATAEQLNNRLDDLLERVRRASPEAHAALTDVAPASNGASGAARGTSATAASGLRLSLQLAGGTVAAARGIVWRITSTSTSDKPVRHTVRAPVAEISLPAGTYSVSVDTSTTSLERTVTVQAGTRSEVVFEYAGGLLELEATAGAGPQNDAASAISSDTIVAVTPAGPAVAAETAVPVWSGPVQAAHSLLLPAGGYTISATNGLTATTQRLDLAKGQAVTVALDARIARAVAGASPQAAARTRPATLIVSAEGLRPAQLDAAEITVAVDEQDAEGRRPIVARSTSPQAIFKLPGGSYRLSLSAFDAENSQVVVLAPGQTAQRSIGLAQMTLQITSHIGETGPVNMAGLRYRLWRADQLEQPLAVRREAQPVFHLAPGKYRVESRIGLQNAVIVREFEVGPGAEGSLQLRHQAGQAALLLPAEARDRRQTPYWQIVDARKRLVWRTFDEAPAVTLEAGTYEAVAELGESTYSAKFVVSSGRDQTVQLTKN